MYIVNLRWDNIGETKYLKDAWSFADFWSAYIFARDLAKRCDDEHFVELDVDNETPKKLRAI